MRTRQQARHASQSTTSQALCIPEILEAVLLQLPVSDLLLHAQLVSRQWNSAIADSTVLQQALFFQPSSAEESTKAVFNSLLKKSFMPWFETKPNRFDRGSVFTNLPWNKSDARRAAFMRKEASWRCMLPVQPPPRVFEVAKHTSYMRGSSDCKGRVGFPEGVRMGTLYDYAYITVSEPISSFVMKWHRLLGEGSDGGLDAASRGIDDEDFVTMAVNWTVQCSRGMGADVGIEFESGGFEELEIEFLEDD